MKPPLDREILFSVFQSPSPFQDNTTSYPNPPLVRQAESLSYNAEAAIEKCTGAFLPVHPTFAPDTDGFPEKTAQRFRNTDESAFFRRRYPPALPQSGYTYFPTKRQSEPDPSPALPHTAGRISPASAPLNPKRNPKGPHHNHQQGGWSFFSLGQVESEPKSSVMIPIKTPGLKPGGSDKHGENGRAIVKTMGNWKLRLRLKK